MILIYTLFNKVDPDLLTIIVTLTPNPDPDANAICLLLH